MFSIVIFHSLAQTDSPLFTNAIGVQAYTYRNSFTARVTTVLDTAEALGITEMEGPTPKNISPEEFKKLLNERGVAMPYIGVDYGLLSTNAYQVISLARLLAQLT